MRILIVFLLISLFSLQLHSQSKPAYKIFNSKGKPVSYGKMIKSLSKNEVILFGEFHNNPIIHWLEIEVTKDLSKKHELVLGAEMFEADNQKAINQYLNGEIDYKGLDTLARLWHNFNTDYKALVDFSKTKHLKFIATNIPRRFASNVFKGGFESLDSLSGNEKKWVAPLPIEYDSQLPGYKKMLAMMGGHGGLNLPKAQAIKDATMAYFIHKNLKNNSLFIHFNGAYHSDNYEGIYWYLKLLNSKLKIKTISTVEQISLKKLETLNNNKADFIIVVPENMVKTY